MNPDRRDADKPLCMELKCHGFFDGCSCQDCVDRQVMERWRVWARARAAKEKREEE